MDEPPPFVEIDQCLLIHDNRHEDEGASDVELVLFFWPPHVPLAHQNALLGACSWVKAFSQSFTASEVRVFEMKRFKLAMQSIGNVNFVLTSGLTYSRKSLETQLEHIKQAFTFYHLSPENVEERARIRIGPELAELQVERGTMSPLREAIIQDYKLAGLHLVPMVQSFHASLGRNFHPIDNSRLLAPCAATGITATSRFLSKASGIIWTGTAVPDFYSGCLLDSESKVICTHLDVDTTRWISNYLSMENSRSIAEKLVYIPKSLIDKLLSDKELYSSPKRQANPESYVFPSSNSPQSASAAARNSEPRVPAQLCMLHRARFSLCMLALYDPKGAFVALHQLADSVRQDLDSLEADLKRLEGPSTSSGIQDSSSSQSNPIPENSPVAIPTTPTASSAPNLSPMRGFSTSLSSYSALGSPANPTGSNLRSSSSASISVNARSIGRSPSTASPKPSDAHFHKSHSSRGPQFSSAYNYLSYNELSCTQEGHVGIRQNDAEKLFFENLSFVHDTFNEAPQISKIVYRDQQGVMYCRKIFGKELYYQQPSSSVPKFADFEEKARSRLSGDHSVHLI